MTTQKTVIISHNDLDGIGASTVLELYNERFVIKDDPDWTLDVRNVHVNDVDDIMLELKREMEEGVRIAAIYILDLTPRQDETWEMLKEWSEASDRPYICILDHHASEAYRADQYDFALIAPEQNDVLMSATTLAHFYCQQKQMIEMAKDSARLDEYLASDFFNFIKYCISFDNLIRAYDTWDWTREPRYLQPKQRIFADHLNTLFWGIGLERFHEFLVKGYEDIVFEDKEGPSHHLTAVFFNYTREQYGREIDLLVRKEEQYLKTKANSVVPLEVEYEGRPLRLGVTIASQSQSKLGNLIAESYDVAVICTGTDRLSFRTKDENIDVSVLAKKYFKGGGHKPAAGGRLEVNLTDSLVKHLTNQLTVSADA